MADMLSILRNKPGFVSLTGASEDAIQRAESELGLAFSKDYRVYLSTYGAVAYEGHELTGISKSPRLDVVHVTLEERQQYPNNPENWYVLEQLHIDDVSIWQASTGEVYQVMPGETPLKICDSLVEYIES
ncbi:MAG: SMI1/KNR4 family protein [Clostridiales bacterium]|nr:SMI1/KNR4 family protein [Clostridiales bacterium]